MIKRLWDHEKQTDGKVRAIFLGSSAILVQKGLTSGCDIWAIEVKSGLPGKLSRLDAVRKHYPKSKPFIIRLTGIL